ncbi:MAG: Lar family restriction alleviation protein [Cypionkella sp.]
MKYREAEMLARLECLVRPRTEEVKMKDHRNRSIEPVAEALHCPFCGNDKAMKVAEEDGYFAVYCDASTSGDVFGCGASSGFGITRGQAIDRWNKRSNKNSTTPVSHN